MNGRPPIVARAVTSNPIAGFALQLPPVQRVRRSITRFPFPDGVNTNVEIPPLAATDTSVGNPATPDAAPVPLTVHSTGMFDAPSTVARSVIGSVTTNVRPLRYVMCRFPGVSAAPRLGSAIAVAYAPGPEAGSSAAPARTVAPAHNA